MGHKIKQKTHKTVLFTCFHGGKRILKNEFTNILNMTTKKNGKIILFAIIITVGIVNGLVGCTIGDSKVNLKNSVSYDGIDYVIQEDIGLDFDGFHDLHEGLDELCEKVGSFRHADVYKIHGLEQSDWIFLNNNSMLDSDDPYGGVYRSSTVKMDTIADFKPDYLEIYYLTPPTSEQSGTEIQIFDTADLIIVEKVVAAIETGMTVPVEKQTEVTRAMYHGDSSYLSYRLEFSSDNYPKLVYRLDYTEDVNGKFYIGYYGDITAYKIIEIDHTLHEYLHAKTLMAEQSNSNK